MIRATSAFSIIALGRWYPFLEGAPLLRVPYIEPSFLKAPSVQITKRPKFPPGASCNRFRRSTEAASTPGMLRRARVIPLSSLYTTRGPFRMVYLRLRILPFPARTFLESATFVSSSSQPSFLSRSIACFVFWTDSAPSETTRGNSATSPMWWPRASTRGGSVLAASDVTTACRFSVTFTRRCHRRQVFVGQNMPPPRHMLPNAPCPDRWVPPPGTRGTRATARPVPQDSAAVSYPAFAVTAIAWRLFLDTLVWI